MYALDSKFAYFSKTYAAEAHEQDHRTAYIRHQVENGQLLILGDLSVAKLIVVYVY